MNNNTPIPQKTQNLIGNTFGRWTVIRRSIKPGYLYCRCSCGNNRDVAIYSLKSGASLSCGCLRREMLTTHGMVNSLTYSCWKHMLRRCTNPNQKHFSYYGGRGIKVCDRWLHNFQAFLDDMGARPSQKYSLDRIDPDGDYTPENCRWATKLEQQRNTRHNINITFGGETHCLSEWAEIIGIDKRGLAYRIRHWSIEKALTQPSQRR